MIAVCSDILFGFAGLCLALHICACLTVAARRLRGARADAAGAGVTLLMPLEQTLPAALEQCLSAAFAEAYPHKEIIFCAGALDKESQKIIRLAREANAAVPSLLIAAREEEANAGGGRGNPLRDSLAKGWKAARYDRVVTALPNAVLPADYIARFIARDRQGDAGRKTKKTGLIFAPLWAVNPRGLRARLGALLMNSGEARRAALADSFGGGLAPGCAGAGLWHYELLNNAGGIDAFMEKAAADGQARAAAELARRQGFAVRLTALPLAYEQTAPINAERGERRGILSGEVRGLRNLRYFRPGLFYAEPLLNIFLPALACAGACFLRGGFIWGVLIAFIIIWHGAGIALNAAWGAGRMGGIKTYALLPVCDILTPLLWLAALVRK